MHLMVSPEHSKGFESRTFTAEEDPQIESFCFLAISGVCVAQDTHIYKGAPI